MGKKKKQRKTAAVVRETSVSRTPGSSGDSFFPHLSTKYKLLVSILLLIGAICVLYPDLVFHNRIFVAGDVEAAVSFATPIERAMKADRIYPLWNPYLFSGMPSYGSLSFNPYVYPIGVITTLLGYLRFPEYTWLLFHTLLTGVGVALLLMDRGINFLIATAAGIMMMWMPNLVAIGANGHGSQACAVAYMPFALIFWDRLWRGKGIILNGSALIIVLGFQILRAHLQISYYTFALVGLHFLFFGGLRIVDAVRGRAPWESPIQFVRRLQRHGRISGSRAAALEFSCLAVVLAIIVCGALLLSAVLYLPVHDYAKYSIRGETERGGLDYDYATAWSLHPKEMLTFLIPFSFGFGKTTYFGDMPFTDYPNYLGLVVILLAVAALFLVKDRFIRFLLFLIVLSTLISFGKHFGILYNPLFHYFPYFNKFRVPIMVLIVQQLAVVILFAFGFSALLRLNSGVGRKLSRWAIMIAVLVWVVVLVTQDYWKGGFASSVAGDIRLVRSAQEQLNAARYAGSLLGRDLIKLAFVLSAAAGVFFLYYRGALKSVLLLALVAGLAALDLYMVNRHILHPERIFKYEQFRVIADKREFSKMLEPDGMIKFLQAADGPFRVFPVYHPAAPLMGDFHTNRFMNFGMSSIGGYHAAKLIIYRDFLESLGHALRAGKFHMVDMLNARYFVASNPLPNWEFLRLVWRGNDYEGEAKFIYENPRALPRLFFVDRYRVARGRAALDELAAGDVDVSREVILAKEPAVMPVTRDGVTAEITRFGFNEIRIHADVPSPCILVLGEVYYPGWEVLIDGRPGEIIQANYILRAVSVPAGSHEIVFRYDTSLIKKALVISVTTFAVVLLSLAVAYFMSSRGRMKWKHSS